MVHTFPCGNVATRLGPPSRIDNPDTVLQTFAERSIDLPIDYEHQNDIPEVQRKGPDLRYTWASGGLDQEIPVAPDWCLGARSLDGQAR
jgi:hypothetical protein